MPKLRVPHTKPIYPTRFFQGNSASSIPQPLIHITCFLCALFVAACNPSEPKHPYRDLTHFSKTFGRDKQYRLYLPRTYSASDTTQYPVIYFFHGWGGRYKSDDNAKLAYDSLQTLVDKYQVLLVMWDGNIDENEPRPYNIGNHNDVRYAVQMKDYFPELIHHIDSAYRTRADKTHRGIIGFSMGGFMSYFLAGKYPDMIGAAVGMTGSPEFFVGYPDRHTLYPLRYTFENLRDVKLRFHNSTADELTYLNTEVKQGAEWDGDVSFDYWQFEGGHMVDLPNETIVFEKAMAFVAQSFKDPLPPDGEWSHYDVYPSFDVHGYQVTSDIRQPGFTYLRHVTREGLGITTKKWLPDGPPLDSVHLQLTTAPVYPANTVMHVVKLRTASRTVSEQDVTTDSAGRLQIALDGEDYELSISKVARDDEGIKPTAITFDYELKNGQRFLRPGDNALRLLVFHPGSTSEGISLQVTSTDSAIHLTDPLTRITQQLVNASKRERVIYSKPIDIRVTFKAPDNAAPPFARLRIETTSNGIQRHSELVIPILFDVPVFEDIVIDDNRKVNDSMQVRGQGNGDGLVQAGERIVIYAKGHPLKLYSENRHVIPSLEETFDVMVPAKWPDGFTLASVVKISDDCPNGTEIEFLANYETKEFMPIKRTVHWGKVRIATKIQP